MALDHASETRLELLKSAPLDQWIAFSADESRIVAQGPDFEEVVAAAEAAGEPDPLLFHVPEDWHPRVL